MDEFTIPALRAFRSLRPGRKAACAAECAACAALMLWVSQSWYLYLNCFAMMFSAALLMHAFGMLEEAI